MAFTTTFSNGRVPNMVKEFTVDSAADIDSIDISQILPGSRAFVIEDSQWYMLSNARTWRPITIGSGGSGGGLESGGDIIYEGGVEGDTPS